MKFVFFYPFLGVLTLVIVKLKGYKEWKIVNFFTLFYFILFIFLQRIIFLLVRHT